MIALMCQPQYQEKILLNIHEGKIPHEFMLTLKGKCAIIFPVQSLSPVLGRRLRLLTDKSTGLQGINPDRKITDADVAQLVEQLIRNVLVINLSPLSQFNPLLWLNGRAHHS